MTTAASGTKKCPHCAEKILAEARKCKHCGEFLDGSQQRAWNPGIAAVLSLLIPGTGQMYKGEVGQGFGWLICTVIGYAIFLVPGIVLHIGCVINAASDSPRKSLSHSKRLQPLAVVDEEERERNIRKMNKQMLTILGVVALGVFLYIVSQ